MFRKAIHVWFKSVSSPKLRALGVAAAIVGFCVSTQAADTEPPNHAVSDAPWEPVAYKANAPIGGVTLDNGLFKEVFDNNVVYLMESFSTNDLLWDFRKRDSKIDPPHDRAPVGFWVTDLLGSNAGRFMMGAGNAVRWTDDKPLRQKLNDVVDGIDACKRPDGYCLAYPPEGFLHSEQANYARSWFTQGLVEAGIAGNPKAYPLIRGLMDWFDHCEYLPKLVHLSLGLQGHIASTRAYFTPIGKPEDIKVAERYYVQDWWMHGLAAHDPNAICRYKLDRPHSYEVVGFEAYLDHYRATGDKRYLEAMNGAWDLMHDDFEHVGGTMAICEGGFYPPKSLYITPAHHTGELCGSVFWIRFNQRFHLLFPDQEKYTAEIEKSIYNVGLANQDDVNGIRYHAFLQGHKDAGTRINTCCEGQGTRLFGSLPEYIFSVARDGLYVDLFEPATITFQQGQASITVKQLSQFPFSPDIALKVSTAAPVKSNIRIRIPSWAAGPMAIAVNGQVVATGKPGSYEPISREWMDGDTISFALPMDFHTTHYVGDERTPGHERFFIEYGPILMAAVGPFESGTSIRLLKSAEEIKNWLVPKIGRPLNFAIAGDSAHGLRPYFQIGSGEAFDCAPIMDEITIRAPSKFVTTDQIEITPATAGAEIRYTTDGSDPTAASPRYNGPFEISHDSTVKAQIFAAGQPHSGIVAESYRKLPLYPPSLRFTHGNTAVEIRVPFPAAGVTIRYTVDGSEPTETSASYSTALPLPAAGTTIKARSFVRGSAQSDIGSFTVPTSAEGSPWAPPDVYLSDLKARTATAGWKTVQMNKNINGQPITLGGKVYSKGIGTHARSVLEYDLKPEYKRFVALGGIDDSTKSLGSVTFEVWIDDVLKYETPVVRGNNDLWHIDVAIPHGSKRIRLVLTDGGDDYNYDFGVWADSGFVTSR